MPEIPRAELATPRPLAILGAIVWVELLFTSTEAKDVEL
jgi:hypothetical protein